MPLVGLALGDALGTTLEFSWRDKQPRVIDLVCRGPFGLAPRVDRRQPVWRCSCRIPARCGRPRRAPPDRGLLPMDGYNSVTGACFDLGNTTRAPETGRAMRRLPSRPRDRGASKERGAISSSGYVPHTLEAALWRVGRAESIEDALILAANLGRDADTVAAVTGQLAGAPWGCLARASRARSGGAPPPPRRTSFSPAGRMRPYAFGM